ncbi:hypothetical protein [Yoonia sediminilitoris]|uniref:Uncharacterized protein n=1 Tax=Yoonia sediminilitoris TaxID=1286148 RepID=A0A2T6KDM6_9RHOB|nr:hypothetical protein [Yoonia sediminilitoris]PUB13103.1 hypothetical protein C8N45_10823 [Yoonia sediminilitoris]RCW94438.1 hypothetical protein DFP92_10824 [Yoonia sediminilitoris]
MVSLTFSIGGIFMTATMGKPQKPRAIPHQHTFAKRDQTHTAGPCVNLTGFAYSQGKWVDQHGTGYLVPLVIK